MSAIVDSSMKNILIIGLGLIGGGYAKGLKQHGYHITAIDIDSAAIEYAIQNSIIDDGAFIESDYASLISRADAVIFGLYPTAMLEFAQRYKGFFKCGAVITDVSGVKCSVVDVIQEILPPEVEFIGSHPMAGREVGGVVNSNKEIFVNANFIITPTEKNTQRGIDFAHHIGELLGFGKISVLSPKEHDEMIGYLSQLTHAIAVSLMNANDNPNLKQFTGDSFRDLTRIARINEVLWSELFFMNKELLISEIDCFTNELQRLKDCLVNDDHEGLKQMFIKSTNRRKYFDE